MTTTLLAFQKQRRDTAANWTSVNPTLLAGEIGLESDTGYWKLGDGSATWTALAYQPWSKLSAYPLVNADIAANAEIAVSKLANGTARQLLQTAANGTDVEWASNIDIPGTLDVTSAATFDSTIGASAGTAALPSITFTGDLNTGIYSPGADQVAVATNGTGRLFVDASGNVGIGTANPSANSVTVSRASGYVECRVNSGSNTATIAVDGTTSYIGNYSNIPLSFTTNSLERLRITSAGLVGVGTSSPSNTLHVVGTGRFNVSGSNNAVIASDSGDPFIYTEQAAGLKFGTNSAVRMTINSSGSVGIGTTSPSELLHIYQPLTNSQAYQLIENNRSRNAATQYKTTLGSWFVGNGIGASVNRFTIYEDGVGDRLVINTSGQVGIGTTSPSQALQVAGAIVATGAATTYSADGIYLQNKGSSIFDISAWRSGASASVLTFSTESGSDASPIERFRCDNSGRLLVGTSSSLGGTVSIAGGGLYLSANDSNAEMQLTRASANTGSPFYYFNKARGTYTSPTVVSDGDICGTINFRGHDGSTYIAGASISAVVDGTPGANDMPGRLVLSTTADGASSPTERMRISQNGVVTIKNGAVAEIGTLTDGATITPDFASNCNFTVTLGGNRTIANPTNLTAGQSGSLFLVQDGTGSRTASWGSFWDFPGGTAPTLTTAANAVDRVDYVVRSSTSIHTVFTANYS